MRSFPLRRFPVGALVVIAFAVVALTLAWWSRSWPLVHDAPILHYIAWCLGDGAAPYRDAFDMNQPGVYVLHLAVLKALGAGDVAWRAFDLAWLGLTALAIAAVAVPWGLVPAVGAALAFAAYHLAGGAWQAGQRDFLLCPFLLVGVLGVARWLEDRGRFAGLACSGAAIGAAVTVKPHAGLLAAALAVIVVITAARAGGLAAAIPAAVTYATAASVAPLAVLAWLAASGGLGAWREAVFDYLLPLYSRLGREAAWAVHRWQVWIALALGVALSVARAHRGGRFGIRHRLALLGVGYGVVHYAAQGKYWEYHLYPLAAFVAVLLFAGLDPALPSMRATAAALVVALLAVLVMLTSKGVEAAPARWERDKAVRAERLAGHLRPQLRPDDTVQVLDTSGGGAHALLRLRVKQPTRFVYDFHFFHDVDTPIVRALRAELLRGLDLRPPRFVVVFEHGWPAGGYDRIAAFPELADRLASRYAVVDIGAGYRIHAKRDHP